MAALSVLCLAQLLDVLDATIVNVALPAIQWNLDFSATGLQWVVNGYTIVFGGLLLLGGRLGDIRGRRPVLLAGIFVFVAASAVSGAANSAGVLVGARAVQGLGAALVAPMTLAMIVSIFPEGAPRDRAITVWGAVTAMGGSLGLIAGGAIVDSLGWRWIFLINIPLGALMLAAGVKLLPADRPTRRTGGFDIVGAITSTVGLCSLVYAIVRAATVSWGSSMTIAPLTAATVLLAYFVFHETRVSVEPLLPFGLLRIRTVAAANLIQLVVGGAMYALFYFASLYLQQVRDYSAFRTGAALIPFTLGVLAFSGISPPLISRIGIRFVLVLGSLVSVGGFVLFSNVSATGSLWWNMIAPSLILSLGLALMFIPVTIASVSGVPRSQNGVASGLLNVNRTVGGSLGLAVLSTVATTRTTHLLHTGATGDDALTAGFRLGFLLAAGLMAAAAIVAAVVFRVEGRGEKVGMRDLATTGGS